MRCSPRRTRLSIFGTNTCRNKSKRVKTYAFLSLTKTTLSDTVEVSEADFGAAAAKGCSVSRCVNSTAPRYCPAANGWFDGPHCSETNLRLMAGKGRFRRAIGPGDHGCCVASKVCFEPSSVCCAWPPRQLCAVNELCKVSA